MSGLQTLLREKGTVKCEMCLVCRDLIFLCFRMMGCHVCHVVRRSQLRLLIMDFSVVKCSVFCIIDIGRDYSKGAPEPTLPALHDTVTDNKKT